MLSLLLAATSLIHALPPAVMTRDGLPSKAPGAVGMSAARLATIDRVVERGIKAGGYPGAAVVVGRRGAAVLERGFGRVTWAPDASNVVAERTIYDLASLTKVVGTTTAIMILFDEGRIQLDDRVSRYLPEFTGGGRENVTIRLLLEHRSGLPAGRDLWRIARTPEEARAAVIATPLVIPPGQAIEYSDLGADILAFVVETASGQRFDRFLEARVFAPLGMTDTRFRPDASLRGRIAPTEMTPPRGYPIRGEVHDENAYALGGIAGHAGIFSTASDLSVFAQMLLNGGTYNGTRIVADSTVQMFTRRSSGTRALGWDTCAGEYGCGTHMSATAYGHTGFTGTSLWIDPDREMFVILLTNRVHAARAKRPATVISDVRADLADAAALAVVEGPYGMLAMPAAFRADRALGWNNPIRKSRSRSVRRGRTTHRVAVSAKRSASRKSARAAASKASSAKSSKGGKVVKVAPKRSSSKAVPVKKPSVKKSVRSTRKPIAGKPVAGAKNLVAKSRGPGGSRG